MFEKASRKRLRFNTRVGIITVEDLWVLPLTGNGENLDDIAKTLNQEVKDSEEESFVVKQSGVNETLKLKFDIVKHIIAVKLAEAEAAENAAAAKAKKERIMEIIASKKDEELKDASIEELQAMVDDL